MAFRDELRSAMDSKHEQRISDHLDKERGKRPIGADEEQEMADAFNHPDTLARLEKADREELVTELLMNEIDSLRARLEALEGA
jgi:hypothetical protein